VRPQVPAGTVLFAAGQTAIAATPIRTGWHVIGQTSFQNFDPTALPPTRLAPGDVVRFTEAA
jgi:inhibitor of KinA